MDYGLLSDSSEELIPEIKHEAPPTVFSNLIDALSRHLESTSLLNYTDTPVPTRTAIAHFLQKVPNSKADLEFNISVDHSLKFPRLSLGTTMKIGNLNKMFTSFLKNLIVKARLESEFISRMRKMKIKSCVDKVRNWVLKTISSLEKEKRHCDLMMHQSKNGITTKCLDLQDEYYWKRFLFYLSTMAENKAIVNPCPNKQELKAFVENAVEGNFLVKNAVSIEDLDFQMALGRSRRLQPLNDRVINVSKTCRTAEEGSDLLLNLITLSPSSRKSYSPQLGPLMLPEHTYLSRTCILYIDLEKFKSVISRPFTMYIYYSEDSDFISQFSKNVDPSTPEEHVYSVYKPMAVYAFRTNGCTFTVELKHREFSLLSGQLRHLISLSENSGLKNLYVVDFVSFYKTENSPPLELRVLVIPM